jgi:uncharacterized membrane protein
MKKQEFLSELELRLYGLNENDKKDILSYYEELIEDKIENERLLEEDVISELGSLDLIAKRVNPNFTGNKIKYEEEVSTISVDNKAARIICEVLRISLIVGLVFACITVFSCITSIIGIIIYLLSQGVSLLIDDLYSGLIMIGFGILLSGVMIIVIPLSIKLIRYVRNYIFKLVKWVYAKLV